MYGAAAIGWGLFLTIPPVVQAAELYRRRPRLADLRRFRRALVDEWGEEVRGEDGTRSAHGRPRTCSPATAPVPIVPPRRSRESVPTPRPSLRESFGVG